MRLRSFVVEDEPLARRALRGFIEEVEWLECVGEAADGASAVRAIDEPAAGARVPRRAHARP